MISPVGCISEFARKIRGKSRIEIIYLTKIETAKAVPKRLYRYILDLIDFQNLLQKNIVSRTKNELFWKQFIPVFTGFIENGEKVEDFPIEIRTLYIKEKRMATDIHENLYDFQ